MKPLIYRLLVCLQIHRLLRFLLRRKTVILVYHGFTDRENHDGIENYDAKHLHVKRFESQMEYVAKHYHVISLHEWLRCGATKSALPPNTAVITFDDGYRSNHTLAYPVLKQMNVPVTIFLTTDFIENKQFLWTDRVEYAVRNAVAGGDTELRIQSAAKSKSRVKSLPQEKSSELVAELESELGEKLSAGENPPEIYRPLEWGDVSEMLEGKLVSFGSHTHTHKILSRLLPDAASKELRLSREIIERRTQTGCHFFCYPNGEEGDFNAQTKQLLKESGYLCGLTSVEGFNDETSDPFELKRLGVSNHADETEFIMTLVGVKSWLSEVKKRFLRVLGKKTATLHGTRKSVQRPIPLSSAAKHCQNLQR